MAVCSALGVNNNISTTEYHPETNNTVERSNSAILSRFRHYVSENQTEWDSYLLPLTYAYNSQVHRSIKVFPFSPVLARTPPRPATVVSQRPSLVPNDDVASLLYIRLELIRWANSLHKKAENNLELAEKKCKRHLDHQVQLASIFNEGEEFYQDRPAIFRSADEKAAAEGYNKLLPREKGPSEAVYVNDNMLSILQDGLENTISIHQDT